MITTRMITSPQLPPRSGYVEVEVDGVRRYRNVSTGVLLEDEPAGGPTAEQILSVLLGGGEQDG